MNTSVILRRAKRKIRNPKRWRKDPRTERHLCAWMAIDICNQPYFGAADLTPAEALFLRAIRVKSGDRWSIVDWNNAPRRTHAQVMRAFDLAIHLAEKEEAKEQRHEKPLGKP
jgi:hypothetical protein